MLRADVAGDRERVARFSREALVLAALSHPNIPHVIGLEEAADSRALVMALVDPAGAWRSGTRPHPPLPFTCAANPASEPS